MAKKKSKGLGAHKVGIGVGLTAAAVTAAGTYFLYGSKNAPKNRKMVKSWALKAKAEVLEALEQAEGITQREYNELIDSIGGVYATMKNVSKSEIADFKREMKSHWKKIETSGAAKKVKKAATKAAKKAVKRVTKKSTKKAAKKTTKKAPAKKAKK